MTIVEGACGVTGGVDTHLEFHVAAALDPVGALLGTAPFPTTPGGYQLIPDLSPDWADFPVTRRFTARRHVRNAWLYRSLSSRSSDSS